jgi:hypothetical protein
VANLEPVSDRRPSPEALLKEAARAERRRLKIFLGAARSRAAGGGAPSVAARGRCTGCSIVGPRAPGPTRVEFVVAFDHPLAAIPPYSYAVERAYCYESPDHYRLALDMDQIPHRPSPGNGDSLGGVPWRQAC